MILSIPALKQSKDTLECGVVCLKMLLDFYEIPNEYSSLVKEFEFYDMGITTPQIGISLLEKGFEVEMVTLNPLILSTKNRDLEDNKEKMLEQLNTIHTTISDEGKKKSLGYLMDFINRGGILTAKIPNALDIKTEIENRRPVIALLTSNFLAGVIKFNFHFNLITGIDENLIYVNDPVSNHQGGEQKHKIDDYLFAIYASAFGDIDNASILKIRRKEGLKIPLNIVDKFVEYGGLS